MVPAKLRIGGLGTFQYTNSLDKKAETEEMRPIKMTMILI